MKNYCKARVFAEERAKLYQLDSTQRAAADGYRATLLQRMSDIRTQDSLRLAGAMINETSYATLVSQRNTAAGQLEAIYYTLDTARHSKIVALATLNSGITTSYACDANHKSVNAIVFHLLLTDTIAAGDLATLESIAEQCPLEGGDAVYEARAFIRQMTGTEYDDLDLCNSSSRPAARQDKQTAARIWELYPNPTSGILRWKNASTGEALVEVYDLLGQLKLRVKTAESFVDLRPLSDGAYWIHFYLPQTDSPIVQKIILIKE